MLLCGAVGNRESTDSAGNVCGLCSIPGPSIGLLFNSLNPSNLQISEIGKLRTGPPNRKKAEKYLKNPKDICKIRVMMKTMKLNQGDMNSLLSQKNVPKWKSLDELWITLSHYSAQGSCIESAKVQNPSHTSGRVSFEVYFKG